MDRTMIFYRKWYQKTREGRTIFMLSKIRLYIILIAWCGDRLNFRRLPILFRTGASSFFYLLFFFLLLLFMFLRIFIFLMLFMFMAFLLFSLLSRLLRHRIFLLILIVLLYLNFWRWIPPYTNAEWFLFDFYFSLFRFSSAHTTWWTDIGKLAHLVRHMLVRLLSWCRILDHVNFTASLRA